MERLEDVTADLARTLAPLKEEKEKAKTAYEEQYEIASRLRREVHMADSRIQTAINEAAARICPHQIGDVVEVQRWSVKDKREYVVYKITGTYWDSELRWVAHRIRLTKTGKQHQGHGRESFGTEMPVIRRVKIEETLP